ncbi:PAC2 family-domain-containing protein [Gaertneriomyces semiglobifer]|nr:PAC2 family-domain-containing protein [Gaertneriomyces semiglobifer]
MSQSEINFHPAPGCKAEQLEGATLVLPSPNGLGNVGQLAVDLLISSLGLERIGFLSSSLILPVVGNDSYVSQGAPELHTNFEVYQSPSGADLSFTVIQLRTPVIPVLLFLQNSLSQKRGVQFAQKLFEWIGRSKVKEVIVVTAADAGRREDRQIMSDRLRLLWSSTNRIYSDAAAVLGYATLEEPAPKTWLPESQQSPVPPGAGGTRFLYAEMQKSDTPMVAAIWFTTEGDNMNDAVQLAGRVAFLLGGRKETIQWKMPQSWQGIYGNLLFTRDLFQ